jgi:hypothetical protein
MLKYPTPSSIEIKNLEIFISKNTTRLHGMVFSKKPTLISDHYNIYFKLKSNIQFLGFSSNGTPYIEQAQGTEY